MMKRMLAMLVFCTAVISVQASAYSTTTVYCAIWTPELNYDDDYSMTSCGDYCKVYSFGDLFASDVDGIEGQIKSDTEYYSFAWYYSKNDGSTWYYGGDEEDCGWELGYYVCTATQTSQYDDWSWGEPPTILRFQYKYTSGGNTYTRYFNIMQLIK